MMVLVDSYIYFDRRNKSDQSDNTGGEDDDSFVFVDDEDDDDVDDDEDRDDPVYANYGLPVLCGGRREQKNR